MSDEVRFWLDGAVRYGGSFVKAFADAVFRADPENYELLRGAVDSLMAKYPKYTEMGKSL